MALLARDKSLVDSATKKSGPSILLVEDEAYFVELLSMGMARKGYDVVGAHDLQTASARLAERDFDLVMLDVCLPDGTGLDLLEQIRARDRREAVIMMSGQATLDMAIEAMKLGARDFLRKPFTVQTLMATIGRVLAQPCAPAESPAPRFIARSAAMAEVRRLVKIFAPTDVSILVLGESGTGKELIARAVHEASSRAEGPFIDFDCTAVPASLLESELFGHEKGAFTDARAARPGKFELAAKGTLFLDEIANLSFDAQAKLLRVLQERTYRRVGGSTLVNADVRVVAATNVDLEDAIARGLFRQDLYFRLAEMTLLLPPLRDRDGDIAALSDHFVAEFNAKYGKTVRGISPEALATLEAHRWPGNVRELQNTIRRALLLCTDRIEEAHVIPSIVRRPGPAAPSAQPASVPPTRSADQVFSRAVQWPERGQVLDIKTLSREVKRDFERHAIAGLLRRYGYNKAELARCLNLDYKVILEKLNDLGLNGPGCGEELE